MSNQEWYNERIKSNLKTQLKNNTRQDIIKGYVDYFTKSMIAINIADKETDPSISKYRFIDIEELRKIMDGDPIFDEYKICTEFSRSLLISHYNMWFGAIDYEIKQIFFKKYSEFIIERTIILLVLCVILIVIGMYIV